MTAEAEHVLIAHQEVGASFSGIYYVDTAYIKKTVNGKDYTDMALRDCSGSRPVKFWGTVDKLAKGDYVFIAANVEDYMGAPSIIARNVEIVDPPADLSDYIPVYENGEEHANTFDELRQSVQNLDEEADNYTCFVLVEEAFRNGKVMARFMALPGSDKSHYGRHGGLLANTVRVATACWLLADSYSLDAQSKSILLSGALLHKLGGLDAFEFRDCMPALTKQGILLGLTNLTMARVQIVLRRVMATEESREKVDGETVTRLLHVIASWPYGGVKPMTPEALVLAQVCRSDAEVVAALDFIEMDQNTQEEFTAFDPNLKRQYYRG